MSGDRPPPRLVFISHTSELRRHPEPRSFVLAAEEAVSATGNAISAMRYFEARNTLPAEACQEKVRDADVYVLIAGFHYGSLVTDLQSSPVSYTELEFDTATAAGTDRLVFLVSDDAHGPATMFVDLEHGSRQHAFRKKVRTGTVSATVISPDDLKAKLIHALTTLPRAGTMQIWNIPIRIPEFKGRADALDALAAALDEGGPAVVHTVTGIGGIGKSSAAIEYAHRHASRFDVTGQVSGVVS